MKRIIHSGIAVSLIFCLLFSSVPFFPTAKAAEATPAYQAYYDILKELIDRQGILTQSEVEGPDGLPSADRPGIYYARVVDMDQNGTPELFLLQAHKRYLYNVIYTYQNGAPVKLLDEEFGIGYNWELYQGSDGHIYFKKVKRMLQRHRVADYYSVTGSQLVYYSLSSASVPLKPNQKPSDVKRSYAINDTIVSVTDYLALKNKMEHSLLESYYWSPDSRPSNTNVKDTLQEITAHVSPSFLQGYSTPSAWAQATVSEAINRKLVPSNLQKMYNQPITRAEFCALAAEFYEGITGRYITERMEFLDTDDVSIQKMGGLGVIQGVGNGLFAPNNLLTREQAAIILTNLSKVLGRELPTGTPNFTDNASISSWAWNQVGQVQAAGVMNGIGDGKFGPKGSYTREQSIVTLLRMEPSSTLHPTQIKLSIEDNTIRVSSTTMARAEVLPTNATNRTVRWESSNSAVAVCNNGEIEGKSPGTATITAHTENGLSSSCKVTVRPAEELSFSCKKLPVTLNCLYLEDDFWFLHDINFTPEDPIIAGTIRIKSVEQLINRSTKDKPTLIISGEVTSRMEGMYGSDFQPYVKYQLRDDQGRIAAEGIESTTGGSVGDSFTLLISLHGLDLDRDYTLSFINDNGKSEADYLTEAPKITLPTLPFIASTNEGTTTVENIKVNCQYDLNRKSYLTEITFMGTAVTTKWSPVKFVWELRDSSGTLTKGGTAYVDYAGSWDSESGYFEYTPTFYGYADEPIYLYSGEHYTLSLHSAE